MSETPINDRQRRAFDSFRSTAARTPVQGIILPKGRPTLEQLQAFVVQAREAVEQASKQREQSEAALQQTVSSASSARSAARAAAFKRMDAACNKLESELRSPSSLRTRMDEGRRSMMPKVEALIQESLTPEIRRERGNMVASIAPEGLRALEAQLPQWVDGWGHYTCTWLDHDMQRSLEELWQPREGDLPLPPPRFEPLSPKVAHKALEIPTLTLQRDQLKLGSGMYRHGRSIIYGFMSLVFLISRFGADSSAMLSGWGGILLGVVLVPCAIGFGYYQVLSERTKERARLSDDLSKKAELAVRDAVRTWLDRAADRLTEDIRSQLFGRRRTFVQWYRGQVGPALQRQASKAEARADQVTAARAELKELQNSKRNVERLKAELTKLGQALG